ncbi:MAG: aldose 1-epimerase family protein [Sarcina sp.]
MLYTLKNEFLTITAHEHGGELHSITSNSDNTEYLWNGNPEYWKYHAPILFPIVGKVNNGTYIVNGETFELPQHGLARLSEFKLIEKTENSLSFELSYSEDTLKIYPYKFSLIIKYTLDSKNVKTEYTVKNLDNKNIDFSIGAHPAYMCPILSNETINDYFFEFEKDETCSLMVLNTSTGLFTHTQRNFLNNQKAFDLSKELFKDDALVFDCSTLNSKYLNLKSKKNNKFISFNFEGFSHLGLWAPAQGAPFVCIEPWFGHADFEDFTGEFKNKPNIINLAPSKVFNCAYTVSIHE